MSTTKGAVPERSGFRFAYVARLGQRLAEQHAEKSRVPDKYAFDAHCESFRRSNEAADLTRHELVAVEEYAAAACRYAKGSSAPESYRTGGVWAERQKEDQRRSRI